MACIADLSVDYQIIITGQPIFSRPRRLAGEHRGKEGVRRLTSSSNNTTIVELMLYTWYLNRLAVGVQSKA